MKQELIKKELMSINEANPAGWTIDLKMNFVTKNDGRWVIAMRETQGNGMDDIDNVIRYAMSSGYVGGWSHDNGDFYLDAVDVFPYSMSQDEATMIAKSRGQMSFYDLDSNKVVYVNSAISHYTVNENLFVCFVDALEYCVKNNLDYSLITKSKSY